MKKLLVSAGVAGLLFGGAATATAAPTPEKGCHGYHTTAYHDGGGNTGDAIGGEGGQAHSPLGRGAMLQAFLAAHCGVGSQK